MGKTPAFSVGSDDVFLVESKWPFLPITPTYDEHVQQSLYIPFPQREGFIFLSEIESTSFLKIENFETLRSRTYQGQKGSGVEGNGWKDSC